MLNYRYGRGYRIWVWFDQSLMDITNRFLGQKTLGLVPYLLLLCKYELIYVKFEIFPRSSKGRGYRLGGNMSTPIVLIYRPQ